LEAKREALLRTHLLRAARLVRFVPPSIEFRPLPNAPRDFALRLSAVLKEATGRQWNVGMGEPIRTRQRKHAPSASP